MPSQLEQLTKVLGLRWTKSVKDADDLKASSLCNLANVSAMSQLRDQWMSARWDSPFGDIEPGLGLTSCHSTIEISGSLIWFLRRVSSNSRFSRRQRAPAPRLASLAGLVHEVFVGSDPGVTAERQSNVTQKLCWALDNSLKLSPLEQDVTCINHRAMISRGIYVVT